MGIFIDAPTVRSIFDDFSLSLGKESG